MYQKSFVLNIITIHPIDRQISVKLTRSAMQVEVPQVKPNIIRTCSPPVLPANTLLNSSSVEYLYGEMYDMSLTIVL